jgi:hypothetical protein
VRSYNWNVVPHLLLNHLTLVLYIMRSDLNGQVNVWDLRTRRVIGSSLTAGASVTSLQVLGGSATGDHGVIERRFLGCVMRVFCGAF